MSASFAIPIPLRDSQLRYASSGLRLSPKNLRVLSLRRDIKVVLVNGEREGTCN